MPIFTYYIYIFLNNINAGGLGAFLRVQSNKKWLDQTSLDVWSPTVHLRDIIDATGALARELMETSSKHDMAGSRELDGQAALNKISFPSLLSSDQRGESWSWKDASTWACQQHVRAPHSPTGICRQGGEKESQDRNSGVTTPVTNSLSDSPPPPLFRAAGCWTGLQIPPSTCLLKGSAVCLTGPWRRRIGRMHRMGERRKKEPFSSTSSEKKKNSTLRLLYHAGEEAVATWNPKSPGRQHRFSGNFQKFFQKAIHLIFPQYKYKLVLRHS